jgi:hypothetical protein
MSEKESDAVSYREDIIIPLQKGLIPKENLLCKACPGKNNQPERKENQ